MTRVVAKVNQQDFVLTGSQSGVLYISSLPVEKNVFKGVHRKVRILKNAFSTIHGSNSQVEVYNTTQFAIASRFK